jgi:hypothetical protein
MFLSPGAKLDKYEIVAPLAVGGMAELYVARARGIEGFETLCVIKRILPQYARDEQFVRMFLDEARLAATLRHPNVIQVHDVGVVKGRYYFAMEYVHGQDLGAVVAAARTARKGLRVGNAVAIAIGVAAGLHHAHERTGSDGTPLQIVHRDVSPGNILISYEGNVKVVDFGIAKAAARATQTTVGGFKGKLSYMSPEQVTSRKDLDHRSDVFSLGVVLYELTTGRSLFRAHSDFLIADKITSGEIMPPCEARPGYDERLAEIVMKALAVDPADRWQSARDLQRALEDYARGAQLQTSPDALGELMRELFAQQILEWEAAQKQGRTLAEYVRHTAEHSAVTLPEEPVAPRPARVPLWKRPSVMIAAVGVVAAIAGWGIVLARSGDKAAASVVEPRAAARSPVPNVIPAPAPAAPPPVVEAVAAPVVPPLAAPEVMAGSAARVTASAPPRHRKRPPVKPKPAAGSGSAQTGSATKPLDQVTNPFAP